MSEETEMIWQCTDDSKRWTEYERYSEKKPLLSNGVMYIEGKYYIISSSGPEVPLDVVGWFDLELSEVRGMKIARRPAPWWWKYRDNPSEYIPPKKEPIPGVVIPPPQVVAVPLVPKRPWWKLW